MAVVLPTVANACKVTLHGTNQGSPFVNSIYLQHGATTLDQATMNALAAAVATAYFNAFSASFTPNITHASTQAIDLSTRQGFVGIDGTPHAGSGTSTRPMPVTVACCVSWTIQDRYRGGHPRMYLPVAEAADVGNGKTFVDPFYSGIKTSASGFHSALNALNVGSTTWQHVAIRYYEHHQLLVTPFVRLVTAAVVRSRVDSMRRRSGKETA